MSGSTDQPAVAPRRPPTLDYGRQPSVLEGQFWFIIKNVVGWLLMLASPVIGIAIPGPGGIPIFLLGFALATIPGKRRMTSHVMRGRPVEVNATLFASIVSFVSVVACAAIIWYFHERREQVIAALNITNNPTGRLAAVVVSLCAVAALATLIGMRVGVWGLNVLLRTLPKARRFVRPWLRKHGVALLPPRRKHVDEKGLHRNENEILEFTPESQKRFRNLGSFTLQWAKRALVLGLTFWIYFKILLPVIDQWPIARERLGQISAAELVGSVLMFALFLGVIRAMSWRAILNGFGYPVPRRPALRVWITSELFRYLPGAIWQVLSRVRQIKPYGVRGSVCSTSQVLELFIFLLANVCLAVCCLFFLGFKHISGPARMWMFVAMCLVPLLSLILHPRVFYGLTDRILKRLGKPPIANRLSMAKLMKLFTAAIMGLLWQSLALWVLLHGPLGIGWRDWWILAGAYCLAWMAGFIAVWAPAGGGVREAVLIGALGFALPPAVRDRLGTGEVEKATLAALAVVTRLWTIAAEFLVGAIAFPLDWRGLTGDPTAPGRVQTVSNTNGEPDDEPDEVDAAMRAD